MRHQRYDRSKRTIALWPLCFASVSAVWPSFAACTTSAPCCRRSRTAASWPYPLAHMRAVVPALSACATFAPCCRRSRATASWPFLLAQMRAVEPWFVACATFYRSSLSMHVSASEPGKARTRVWRGLKKRCITDATSCPHAPRARALNYSQPRYSLEDRGAH